MSEADVTYPGKADGTGPTSSNPSPDDLSPDPAVGLGATQSGWVHGGDDPDPQASLRSESGADL